VPAELPEEVSAGRLKGAREELPELLELPVAVLVELPVAVLAELLERVKKQQPPPPAAGWAVTPWWPSRHLRRG
jgi:hypothetical protein